MKKFLIIIFLFPITLFAQSDKSVSVKNVPQTIPEHILKNYPSHTNVSYFIEKNADTMFYEADFTYLKQKYSLLFDTLGNVFEIEIEISFKKLTESVKKLIEEKFSLDLKKYKIKKAQAVDYRGMMLYEIQVRGTKNKDVDFYEYYFNRSGKFIKVETIDLKPIPSLY